MFGRQGCLYGTRFHDRLMNAENHNPSPFSTSPSTAICMVVSRLKMPRSLSAKTTNAVQRRVQLAGLQEYLARRQQRTFGIVAVPFMLRCHPGWIA